MGYVNFSMPRDIVIAFGKAGGIRNFVETGTFRGGTAFWAAEHFNTVYTIEIDPEISRSTAAQPGRPKNIEFFVGNSSDVLPDLMSKLSGRSIFWLDGHWCDVTDLGKDMECPLLDELKGIAHLKDAVILIDDARAFLGPLPPPHDNTQWPRVDEIFLLLKQQFPENLVTIADDVIYCIPPDLIPVFDRDWIARYPERFVPKPGLFRKVLNKIKS